MDDTLPGPVSRFFVAQRLRLHFVDWGNPDAPPLLLLHGARDHCRAWDWVAARLRGRFRIIAPDLRGHGDSAWSPDGDYATPAYVYDLAQLIHLEGLAPLPIVAHSLGAHVALRYAASFPEAVSRLVAIEGLGPSPARLREREAVPLAERTRAWIEARRALAARQPRRYAARDEALARMQAENPRLSPAQARHLTEHGMARNEDGTWSWKFDNYVRQHAAPNEPTLAEAQDLWSRIACPTLLVHGRESWASDPEQDGRAAHFPGARVLGLDGAGHWVHHDRLDAFMAALDGFL